jgi:hypothetical protein
MNRHAEFGHKLLNVLLILFYLVERSIDAFNVLNKGDRTVDVNFLEILQIL